MKNMQMQELISALADGQLAGEDFARGVDLAASDPVAREIWQNYHLIGDVLRLGPLAVGTLPAGFVDRLQPRLAQELPLAPPIPAQQIIISQSRTPAANDTSFRWKMVAGVASVAAVGVLAWSLAGGLPGKVEPAQLATVPADGTVLAAGERGVMIRDAHLDELLAAHRQLGGPSALQMPAGFVRHATFDGSNR